MPNQLSKIPIPLESFETTSSKSSSAQIIKICSGACARFGSVRLCFFLLPAISSFFRQYARDSGDGRRLCRSDLVK
ncbi:hypothetical protein YC2023_017876 [Brassica napus]